MKKNLLFLFFIFFISFAVNAQLLLEENFNFTSGNPLVAGAVASSDNAGTSTTGWLTMSNSASGINCFTISATGLTYSGYTSSGIGKALDILDNDGQDVFKTFSASNTNPTAGAPFPGPKTIYIAFLIKVPAGDKTGADFFMGIKYSNSATDANYMGRIFAKVTGNNVQFGISKSTTPATAWTNDYQTGQTYLLVLKYTMGGLNGTSVTEETNKYDDKVELFVNPAPGAAEPVAATLHYENSADKDAYRYSASNSIIGGLAAIYFRTPGTGAIPAATIDGIRVADTWAKVLPATTSALLFDDDQKVYIYMDQPHRQLKVNIAGNNFYQFEIYSAAGSKIYGNSIRESTISVNMSGLNSGIYIIRMMGASSAYSAKFFVQ
jgi:hypothetical protein